MPKPNLIQVHIIPPYGPAPLNRDENGIAVRLPPSITAALFGRMITSDFASNREKH